MPTFNDLYYADMGNSKLNPEYVTQYDAGFAYTKTWENYLSIASRYRRMVITTR